MYPIRINAGTNATLLNYNNLYLDGEI